MSHVVQYCFADLRFSVGQFVRCHSPFSFVPSAVWRTSGTDSGVWISLGRVCRVANPSHHKPAAGVEKKKPPTGSWTYLLGALLIGVPSPACNFQCFGGVLAALPIKLETDNNTVRQQETHGTSQRSSNEIPQAWLNNVHDVAKQSFPHRP